MIRGRVFDPFPTLIVRHSCCQVEVVKRAPDGFQLSFHLYINCRSTCVTLGCDDKQCILHLLVASAVFNDVHFKEHIFNINTNHFLEMLVEKNTPQTRGLNRRTEAFVH